MSKQLTEAVWGQAVLLGEGKYSITATRSTSQAQIQNKAEHIFFNRMTLFQTGTCVDSYWPQWKGCNTYGTPLLDILVPHNYSRSCRPARKQTWCVSFRAVHLNWDGGSPFTKKKRINIWWAGWAEHWENMMAFQINRKNLNIVHTVSWLLTIWLAVKNLTLTCVHRQYAGSPAP